MSEYRETVITDKGLQLIAKAKAGLTEIKYTKLCAGSGIYTSADDLEKLSALKAIRQEIAFNMVEVINDNTVRLKAVLDNNELAEGYRLTELGIFAEDPDLGEILYSITIAKEPDFIPGYNGSRSMITVIEMYAVTARAESVTIQASSEVYALAEDLEELKVVVSEQVVTELGKKANKVAGASKGNLVSLQADGDIQDSGVAADEVILKEEKGSANGVATLGTDGLVPSMQLPGASVSQSGIVKASEDIGVDTTTGAMSVKTTFTQAGTLANIVSGESLKTLWGKLSRWYTALTGKLDKSNVANNLTTTADGYALDARIGQIIASIQKGEIKPARITNLNIPIYANMFQVNGFVDGAANSPFTGSGYVVTSSTLGNYGIQNLFTNGNYPAIHYTRGYSAGSWGSWQKIIDSSSVANNLITNTEGFVLGAQQGKILNDKIEQLNSNLVSAQNIIDDANGVIRRLKYLPVDYIDIPNEYFEVTGWGLVMYFSLYKNTSIGWSFVLGIHDNNNGTFLGRQFAIGTFKIVTRTQSGNNWTEWTDI